MMLVKAVFQRGPAVPRCPKGDPLSWIIDFGAVGVIGCDQPWNIDERRFRRWFAGEFMDRHVTTSAKNVFQPSPSLETLPFGDHIPEEINHPV
jgi:hypothetical protein